MASEDRLDWLHISDLNPDAYNNKIIGHDAVCRKQALSLLSRHRALINGDGVSLPLTASWKLRRSGPRRWRTLWCDISVACLAVTVPIGQYRSRKRTSAGTFFTSS